MIRLPRFQYYQPSSLAEACKIMAGEEVSVIAGGTDILPNMKRRQQTPKSLVSLRNVSELFCSKADTKQITLGAMTTLQTIATDTRNQESYRAMVMAAAQVATPQIQNMASLGGNLLLDTRCNYYDQSYHWRKSIDFCMKKDGKTCWVAPSSPRCWAVSSTDLAPTLLALDAQVELCSAQGKRVLDLDELYHEDGMQYLNKRRDEILTQVFLPVKAKQKSTYWKFRRRGSFDFPVLSVAVAAVFSGETIEQLRVTLGAVASAPLLVSYNKDQILGHALNDQSIEHICQSALELATPLDNTDFELSWRKKVLGIYVRGALREIRGDEVSELSQVQMRKTLPLDLQS